MNYYDQIKGLLISNEIHKKVKDYSKNKSDLDTYYNVGKLIVEAQGGEARAKYGKGLIKDFSKRLMVELKDKKYSYRNLMNMRKFYLLFKNENVNALRSQLSWSHYRELLPINDMNIIKYYINQVIENNLSYRELGRIIRNNEYERLSIESKEKLINNDDFELGDGIKNPIIINNKNNLDINNIKEKVLQELILDDLNYFLKQLGSGFSYISNEYKIRMENSYNYIDILLYNYIFKSFTVVELKVTELKKDHIGQIQVYMNYIDKNVKQIDDNKTIGLIVVKENNNYIIKYSSDNRIKSIEYKIKSEV